MKDIVISGLSEKFLHKLAKNVDDVTFGYSNIQAIILNPANPCKTNVIFVDNEKYNRTFFCSVEYIFKVLSEE